MAAKRKKATKAKSAKAKKVKKLKATKAKKATTRKTTAKKTTRKTTAKKTTRKTTVKKTTRKTTTKKTAAKSTVKTGGPIKVGKKAMTKSELFKSISAQTGLSAKEVGSVITSLSEHIDLHVTKKGPQEFKFPGLFKIVVIRKPATKARKGINPFTGEETVFKAKPARNVVKIRPLKNLKEAAV